MAVLSTHQIPKPNFDKTGSKKKHIGLLAEARSDHTGLDDAIQVAEGLLNAIEQVGIDAMSTCMVLSYRKMLFKEINTSETLLAACQEKINKLTGIYSSSCPVTNQLKGSISSCKRKLIKTKKRSQHALPDRGLDTPTASPLVCSDAKSLKGFVSQDLEKIESERKQKMVEEILPYRIEEATEEPGRSVSTLKNPETSSTDYSGIQEMFMEAPASKTLNPTKPTCSKKLKYLQQQIPPNNLLKNQSMMMEQSTTCRISSMSRSRKDPMGKMTMTLAWSTMAHRSPEHMSMMQEPS